MVAVQQCEAIGMEQPAVFKGVEHAREQCSVPPVQQVAGNRQVYGIPRHDAVELAFQRRHIGLISDVKIRQMRDQHMAV